MVVVLTQTALKEYFFQVDPYMPFKILWPLVSMFAACCEAGVDFYSSIQIVMKSQSTFIDKLSITLVVLKSALFMKINMVPVTAGCLHSHVTQATLILNILVLD